MLLLLPVKGKELPGPTTRGQSINQNKKFKSQEKDATDAASRGEESFQYLP